MGRIAWRKVGRGVWGRVWCAVRRQVCGRVAGWTSWKAAKEAFDDVLLGARRAWRVRWGDVHGLTDGEFGAWAERRAGQYLTKKGYRVLTRNFRAMRSEIDLVVSDGRRLVFVEVKAERSMGGRPERRVTVEKQRHVDFAARVYLKRCRRLEGVAYRFDVVAVEVDDGGGVHVTHIEKAFVPAKRMGR